MLAPPSQVSSPFGANVVLCAYLSSLMEAPRATACKVPILSQTNQISPDRAERKAYIKAKYEERQFLRPLCNNQHELFSDLEAAIDTHNIYDLLQSVEEAPLHGVDVTDPLPTSVSSSFPTRFEMQLRWTDKT